MAPNKYTMNIIVSEEFRIQSELILRNFIHDENAASYEFPTSLTNIERAWLHNYAKTIGLTSKSFGKEPTRRITLSKPNADRGHRNRISLSFFKENFMLMREFFARYPRKDHGEESRLRIRSKNNLDNTDTNTGQLTFGIPQMPNFSLCNDLISFRMELPIWPMRETLMEAVVSNQVVIVCGETGSGKTTQIPQFILDYSASVKEKTRIICTQPRRISAVAVAERVAAERGEKSGQTVGFHIRLESCVGPKTVLVYCTNGILLRTLMNGDACLNAFTHIIVDEIHERDRFSDFLLICLRECLVNYPHLRLILMSATMDVNTFQTYFNNAPVIFIPGRLYSVTEYFMEDILKKTKYESQAMATLKKKNGKAIRPLTTPLTAIFQNYNIDVDLQLEMIECINDCVQFGSEESFTQLLQLILSDHAPVNFQHPDTMFTGLIAAAMHGNLPICTELLNFGADVKLTSNDKLTASDWARTNQHVEVVELLKHYELYTDNTSNQCSISDDDKELLDLYHSTITDQIIDFDLLLVLLYNIHIKNAHGSILIFLPGYDDIITVRDRIQSDTRFKANAYQIFMLHSLMQITEQHEVFNHLTGKRKIILSTNIAETSITIDDVVYVINSGKVKEKCYDSITGICSLQSAWISQACAKQRAGRAGRTQPGVCFHMFSKFRHNSMQEFSTPEILRMPLHELCLQTKMLAPRETKIADFLSRALEPPSSMAVNNAIKHLLEIGALDEHEDLTLLGQHLVDLPVEPRLAKILIYSVIFKCIDPLLTIVAFLSYRDPFVLPSVPHQKNIALNIRKQFSSGTFSDHMILLRIFQAWQDARLSKAERLFCSKYYVSSATMEMVVNIRSQLLAQLRASGFVKTKPPGDIRDLNENANNWALIKGILTAGFYPNIAFINKHSMQIRTKNEKKVMLHTSSSLRMGERHSNNQDHIQSIKTIPTSWLTYEELSRNGNTYTIRSATAISPLVVALFVDHDTPDELGPPSSDSDDEDTNVAYALNNWIVFESTPDVIQMLKMLRDKINGLIAKKISNPFKTYGQHDDALVTMLATVIQNEDSMIGFYQPPGIGQRPKIMMSNNYPPGYSAIGQANPKPRQVSKKQERIAMEILQFKRVHVNHYNKFLSHESPCLPPIGAPILNPQTPQSNQFNLDYLPHFPQPSYMQPELNQITQNMEVLSLYNNIPYNNFVPYNYTIDPIMYPQPPYAEPIWQVQSDFSNNGVTVDMEAGACALEPHITPEPLYECNAIPQGLSWNFHLRDPENTLFFIIKTGSIKAIDVSISKKTWIFSPQTERKILREFQTGQPIILIFTVQMSNFFHGIARLINGPSKEVSHYNLNCPIEWLSRADIPFEQLSGFISTNCADGDKLDPKVGIKLLMMFTNCTPTPPMQLEACRPSGGRPITKSLKH